ncbi:MAG: hypothetical protein H6855_05815 [Rhodospirillales bacterium]|nr:hypothetical protein [Rhodospirillales bacterium]MCB9979820.1 hypothetical protein [Rhodospirillales bacterium]
MSHQNEILTYLIEHLGIPLMVSMSAVHKEQSLTPDREAEMMAKLLTASVQLGLSISAKMNVPSDVMKAEALRFRLTALAAEALSQRARLKGKEPAEVDIDSLKGAMDSLFVFSEHFSIDEKGVAYLKDIGFESVSSPEITDMAVIESLLPVIAAMDHKDRGLFPNVADRLAREASDIAADYIEKSGAPEGSEAVVRQKMLQLLSHIFSGIYPEVIGKNRPIGDVWQEFDRKKSLLLLLINYLLDGQAGDEEDVAEDPVEPVVVDRVTDVSPSVVIPAEPEADDPVNVVGVRDTASMVVPDEVPDDMSVEAEVAAPAAPQEKTAKPDIFAAKSPAAAKAGPVAPPAEAVTGAGTETNTNGNSPLSFFKKAE